MLHFAVISALSSHDGSEIILYNGNEISVVLRTIIHLENLAHFISLSLFLHVYFSRVSYMFLHDKMMFFLILLMFIFSISDRTYWYGTWPVYIYDEFRILEHSISWGQNWFVLYMWISTIDNRYLFIKPDVFIDFFFRPLVKTTMKDHEKFSTITK